ncbi:MAG: response regulator transcription factor [Tannerellaceae bacterium]|jgi:DNA-binding NarL/FixJ family response regulator|nr:response regulator transcription factor [Tannerellaceae bacterium]
MEMQDNSQLIRLSIVDDHKMVVESLSKQITKSGIARITGVYYDLKSCRQGLEKNLPDILLLDIGLPDGDGVDFCAEIAKSYPRLKIIMLTTYKEFSIAKRALHNGALGYILKNAEIEEMLIGIETVSRGERFLCEEIDILLNEKKNEDVVWLGKREKEVLGYIAEGYTSKEIASFIHRDEETVRTYRRNLLIKLVAKNTPEAVKKGYEKRLIW